MRKTTLLPTATGVLVGLNRIFVTFTAALFTVKLIEVVLVTVPPLAVAKFVAVPVSAVVMKLTVMLVLWPGAKLPRFVQVNTPAPAVLLVGTAPAKVNRVVG